MRGFLLTVVAALAAMAFPTLAAADHLHVIQLGSGECVVLAESGQERYVTLPEASFQNTTEPTTTANPHSLHVHVHRADPGEAQTIAVYGSELDPCAATGNYVNAP